MSTGATPPTQADRLTYPQLSPREVQILRAWLLRHETEFDSYDYNVRVGEGLDPGPTYTDAERAVAMHNSKKRIDAVAMKGAQATIIEVKDRAGAAALGELLTYKTLYDAGRPNQPPALLMLVTNLLQPDMLTVLVRFGVSVQFVAA